MSNQDDNIPMLTDILQVGDEEMHHHFDAHQFDGEDDTNTSHSIQLENASAAENTVVDSTEPVIQLYMDNEKPLEEELANEDFSESMQPPVEDLEADLQALQSESTAAPDVLAGNLSETELKDAVDQAITELLPQIEDRLKKTLYKKLGL